MFEEERGVFELMFTLLSCCIANQAAKAGLTSSCPVCKAQMQSYAILKEHYEAKHPKAAPLPPQES